MYNLRYHIASLVSVFLALALGLVLGGLVVQRGTFDQQQVALVKGLQKEFKDLRTENEALSTENKSLNGLSGDLVNTWAAGRLTAQTVVAIVNGGREDGLSEVRKDVEAAGGTVAVVTLLKPGFALDDSELGSAVASLAPNGDDAVASLAAALAAEWKTKGPRPLTDALVTSGVLRVDGLDADTAASRAVDIAAPDGKADPAGIALAKAFDSPTTTAIVAENPGQKTGMVAAARDAGLSSLDTLGTTTGRYTLVALLSGANPGNYGTTAGTDALYPPLPQ